MYVKTDHEGLLREAKSKAIVTTDVKGLKAYHQRRNHRLSQEERISNLESSLGEIKDMLKELLGRCL